MAENLDMSLDAIIQRNKQSRRGGGGGGGGDYGVGPVRRFRNDVKSRSSPYFTPPPQRVDQKQMQSILVATSDADSETKLYISNLDYGVTNDDIKVLFSEVGVLKRYSIHYDKSGRSKGTAEVVFARQSDAFDAVRRFNNVHLDGKPMRIEMVGLKLVTPGAITVPPTSNDRNQGGAFRRQERNERNAGRGWDRGGGRGSVRGRGRRRGRGRGRSEMSTADLDADLEKYHKDAMETN